ncbi:MAG: helix-turn-helix domain-containing protein [Bacteroidota bacterium]
MVINTYEIKQFIDQNLKEVDSIYSISSRLQVSYNTLRKSFLREEQVSLADYINQQKVQAMKELLLMDNLPCFCICLEFGFREDTGAKVFKKLTGMTMREFRKRNQPN